VGEGRDGIQFGEAIGDLEIDALEVADRLTESFSPVSIACGKRQAGPVTGNTLRQTFRDHHMPKNPIPAILFTNQVFSRYAYIAEKQSSRAISPGTHKAVDMFDRDTFASIHDE
jgi:hypothetical protein